ncbi:substrate-binding domain-containing protein [Bifidobacterium aerophilum]|uniref:LacI family DNA-binding transcriptional regulator n=1 Tax=Bifidobacterium aerophilum TaxID=1798155 RepID=A0A6N9Z269_9BIFI|nr:LacI family DNA-binding transcriptional regulator [Bifidobacterium aerophilum]
MAYVTIRDVARGAGVSITAVSQILHGKGRFSPETRRLVMDTVERMGYVPDQRAQSMRSNDMTTVGLLVPDLRNPYFADLVASMEDDLYRHGVSTLIGTSAESAERQDAFIANLLGQRIDGAIVVPQGVDSPGMKSLVACGMPLVFVDRRVPGIDDVPFVVSDPRPGIEAAVETLTRLGHRRIGFVAHSSLGSFSINERETAFRETAARLLPAGGGVVVDCAGTYASRRRVVDELLEAEVTAIVCAYSPDTVTMLGLLAARGIRIGADLSVVSFDDIDEFRLMVPQIAVISQQADRMGRIGVDMLLRRVKSSDGGERTEPASGAVGGTARDGRTDDDRIGDIHYVSTVFLERASVGAAPNVSA